MEYEKAPGFRFFPTEEELVSFYLQQKLDGRMEEDLDRVIPVLYIYDYNPWNLPQLAGERCRRDPQLKEWFFFIPRQEREGTGGRPNRLTTDGYWKATGSPGWVYSSDETHRIIGLKRTMVFYRGRARDRQSGEGSKTEWKMNEYMAIDLVEQPPSFSPATAVTKGEYSVCRVYKKSKCLRAFDRRPIVSHTAISPEVASSSHPFVDHHQQQANPSDHHENEMLLTEKLAKSSSVESSPPLSGDHTNNTNADLPTDGSNQGNIMDFDMDQGPLWDFDSLKWSC